MEHESVADSDRVFRRASDGDEEAQAELLDRHRERLRRMIEIRLDRRVVARVDASDIVQETLANAYKRLPDYFADPKQSFFAWLRRIARDRLVDVYRAHIGAERRSVLKEDPWSPYVNDDAVGELADQTIASELNPNHHSLLEELKARTNRALRALHPRDREILLLRYLEQMSVREIADELGISETAVTSRHSRALRRLRQSLADGSRAG